MRASWVQGRCGEGMAGGKVARPPILPSRLSAVTTVFLPAPPPPSRLSEACLSRIRASSSEAPALEEIPLSNVDAPRSPEAVHCPAELDLPPLRSRCALRVDKARGLVWLSATRMRRLRRVTVMECPALRKADGSRRGRLAALAVQHRGHGALFGDSFILPDSDDKEEI